MKGYKTALQALQESRGYSQSAGDSRGVRTCEFAELFVPSLAPAYPSITDELKKDVAILTRSLAIREKYIDDLRKTRDKLTRKLDISDMRIDCLKKDIERYREFFYETKEREKIR